MRWDRNCLLSGVVGLAGFLAASQQAPAQRLCSDFGMGNGGYAAGYSMTVSRGASRGWSLGGGWGYGCESRSRACPPFGAWAACGWAGRCGPRICGGLGYRFGWPAFGFGGWAGCSTIFGSQSVFLATPQAGGATFFSGAVVPYLVPYAVPYPVPYALPYPVPWFGVRSGPPGPMPVVAAAPGADPAGLSGGRARQRPLPPPRVAAVRGRQRARVLVAKGDQLLRESGGDATALKAVAETYRRAAAAAADDPEIHIRHAIALAAAGRHKEADAAVSKAMAIDGRLADHPVGEPLAVVARGAAILRAIAQVEVGPLPGHLADVAAIWAGERGGAVVRLAAAGGR